MKPLPLAGVSRGYRSDIKSPCEYVIRTEEEWKSVFQQAFPGRSFDDHGAGYDFSTLTLIAVFLGKSPERSAIKIEEVREDRDTLEIVVSRNIRESGEHACSPYHIVRIPETEMCNVRFSYQDNPNLSVSDIKHF